MSKTAKKPAKAARTRRAAGASRRHVAAVKVAAPEPVEDVPDAPMDAMAQCADELVDAAPDAAAPDAMAADTAPVEAPAAAPAAGSAGRAGLRLESSCMLRDALDMQFQLLSADFGPGEVLVDGSGVERVDTAGLQLLVAFVQHHATQGRHVGWTGASEDLRRAANRLGLAASINLPQAEGSAP